MNHGQGKAFSACLFKMLKMMLKPYLQKMRKDLSRCGPIMYQLCAADKAGFCSGLNLSKATHEKSYGCQNSCHNHCDQQSCCHACVHGQQAGLLQQTELLVISLRHHLASVVKCHSNMNHLLDDLVTLPCIP